MQGLYFVGPLETIEVYGKHNRGNTMEEQSDHHDNSHDLISNIDLEHLDRHFTLDRFSPVRDEAVETHGGATSVSGGPESDANTTSGAKRTARDESQLTNAQEDMVSAREIHQDEQTLEAQDVTMDATNKRLGQNNTTPALASTLSSEHIVEASNNGVQSTTTERPGSPVQPSQEVQMNLSSHSSPPARDQSQTSHKSKSPGLDQLTAEQKKEKQRESNRLAALKSRGKKRGEMSVLSSSM